MKFFPNDSNRLFLHLWRTPRHRRDVCVDAPSQSHLYYLLCPGRHRGIELG